MISITKLIYEDLHIFFNKINYFTAQYHWSSTIHTARSVARLLC